MRVNGRDVLYALRDLERWSEELNDEREVPSYLVAQKVGRRDGRAVVRPLHKLEQAGLTERIYPTLPLWRTTPRGREVERILSFCDARRGGTFRPMVEVIPDSSERFALLH